MHQTAAQPIYYALLVLFIVVRFLMRELRERHLSNVQLFVLPGILLAMWLALAISAGANAHPDFAELGLRNAIALPFGVLVGFGVARFTTVRIGDDGKIFFRGSYVTVAIWLAALALRFGARYVFPSGLAVSSVLASSASLVLLVFVATAVVRLLVYRKANAERSRSSTLTETAV
jgi:hypothetical protein